MSGSVDVLAVMERDAHHANHFRWQNPQGGKSAESDRWEFERQSREAQVAIAAFIEAASTRSNVMTEIKRGSLQWDGVPEFLEARIEKFDAALARVKGESQ